MIQHPRWVINHNKLIRIRINLPLSGNCTEEVAQAHNKTFAFTKVLGARLSPPTPIGLSILGHPQLQVTLTENSLHNLIDVMGGLFRGKLLRQDSRKFIPQFLQASLASPNLPICILLGRECSLIGLGNRPHNGACQILPRSGNVP